MNRRHVWRERCLSLLLAVEVAASVVLTVLVASASTRTPVGAERTRITPQLTPRREPDLLAPLRAWGYPGGGTPAILGPQEPLYTAVWQALRGVAGRILDRSPFPDPVDPTRLPQDPAVPFLGVDLPVTLPAGLWADALRQGAPGIGLVRGLSGAWSTPVDRIAVTLAAAGNLYLVGPDGALRFPLPQADLEALLPLARALSSAGYPPARRVPVADAAPGEPSLPGGEPVRSGPLAADPWVLVPVGAPSFRHRRVDLRPPDRERLVERLFPDPAVAQEIEEAGATVYTDGARALRLHRSGVLEYTEPQPGRAGRPVEPLDALAALTAFATPRGLWPGEAQLRRVVRGAGGTRLEFRVPGPALPVDGPPAALVAEVAGSATVYFYRLPDFAEKEVGPPESLVPADVALQVAWAASPDPAARLRSLELVQRWDAGAAGFSGPVWAARFGTRVTVWVDARSGEVLPAPPPAGEAPGPAGGGGPGREG